jgi:hypothetical protein
LLKSMRRWRLPGKVYFPKSPKCTMTYLPKK